MIDGTHDPARCSWVPSANDPASDFPIQNLPFGTFESLGSDRIRLGVAIGNMVFDVTAALGVDSLNGVMAMPSAGRTLLRHSICHVLDEASTPAFELLTPMSDVRLLPPCAIGDYTDFYASLDHATNVGRMFRPDNPLLTNYKWLPVAYHGRASSVVVSGTTVRRPQGQVRTDPLAPPVFGPTRMLDYEIELGAFLGPGNPPGESIPIGNAAEHIVGVCLLNDWSARDVQAWEYQPLGPFLSKSFATSISPWVVMAEALEPFRCPSADRDPGDPQPLPHLSGGEDNGYRITLEVWLRTKSMKQPVRLSRGHFAGMYWTLAQMVAHHTSNGCNLRPGDLIGSGTVSGPQKENRGCLLELTWRGAEPLTLPNGEIRTFLEDDDEVILRGWCDAPGIRRIGLGECVGKIVAL